MATFEITGPDGVKYRVQGDNAEGAVRAVSSIAQKPIPLRPEGSQLSVAPGTTPDQAASIPRGMVFDPSTGGYVDTAIAAERMGAGQGANASFLAGAPFVGEYADEAMGAADSALTGRNPEIATQTMRESRQQFAEDRPGMALGLEVAGGVAGSLPAAGPVIGAVARAPGVLGKTVAGIGAGVVAGGTEGAIAGYGRGETPEDRASMAREGGAVGAGLGGLLGALSPVFGNASKAAYLRIRRLDVSEIATALDVDRRTAGIIKRHLMNDDLDAARAKLTALGDDAMLADAGPGTMQMLDTASQTGGAPLRIGTEAASGRAATMGAELPGKLDKILTPASGINAAARDISSRTAGVRQKAYDVAYRSAIDYSAPAGRKIEGVLGKVPTQTLQKAIQEANDAMQAAGLRNMQIMAEIGDNGAVVFREMPNVQQLDELKKALSQIVESSKDDFGRIKSGEGLRAMRLAGELRDAIGDAVPAYNRAVRLGGDKIAEDNSLRLGRDLLKPGTTVEDVRAIFGSNPSAEARIAAVRGFRETLQATIDNTKRTITDPDTDARAAMQVIKDLSSNAAKEKMTIILGPGRTNALQRELEKVTAALELRAVMAMNSKTAIRTAGREAVDAATSPNALFSAGQGKPVEAAQKVIMELTGATDDVMVARREKIFTDIARALTEKRGADAERALGIVQRAMSGQPIKDAEAQFVTKVAGAPLVLGAYQSGLQALEKPRPDR